jgi:hypothetical protein
MAEKTLKATGIFEGLRIPESCRGKYLLMSRGRIVKSAATAGELFREAVKVKGKPVIIGVPADDRAIAAY